MSTTKAAPNFLLATQTPEDATGFVAEIYKRFPPQAGVPAPLRLFSASPGLLEAMSHVFGYLGKHPRLSFELLAAIRHLASRELDAPDCREFNRALLKLGGFTDAEVDSLPEAGGEFSPAERALLAHCVLLVRKPEAIDAAHVDALRAHGWTDADILDASTQASNMQGPALLLRAFKR